MNNSSFNKQQMLSTVYIQNSYRQQFSINSSIPFDYWFYLSKFYAKLHENWKQFKHHVIK